MTIYKLLYNAFIVNNHPNVLNVIMPLASLEILFSALLFFH